MQMKAFFFDIIQTVKNKNRFQIALKSIFNIKYDRKIL